MAFGSGSVSGAPNVGQMLTRHAIRSGLYRRPFRPITGSNIGASGGGAKLAIGGKDPIGQLSPPSGPSAGRVAGSGGGYGGSPMGKKGRRM